MSFLPPSLPGWWEPSPAVAVPQIFIKTSPWHHKVIAKRDIKVLALKRPLFSLSLTCFMAAHKPIKLP